MRADPMNPAPPVIKMFIISHLRIEQFELLYGTEKSLFFKNNQFTGNIVQNNYQNHIDDLKTKYNNGYL